MNPMWPKKQKWEEKMREDNEDGRAESFFSFCLPFFTGRSQLRAYIEIQLQLSSSVFYSVSVKQRSRRDRVFSVSALQGLHGRQRQLSNSFSITWGASRLDVRIQTSPVFEDRH